MTKLIAAAVLATLVATPAFAGVNGRQAAQQGRILHGIVNGSLTPGEVYRLEMRAAAIRGQERFLRNLHGGTLTPLDKFVLHRRLNRTSKAIWRLKHN